MISKEEIRKLVEEIIAGGDIFIVDVVVSRHNRIEVIVDTPEGITIAGCVELSRKLERRIDRDSEDFELEVSSPGLERPFRVIAQYRKNLNRLVEVTTRDGLKLKGILAGVSDHGIELNITETDGKCTDKADKTSRTFFGFDQVKSTKIVVVL